MKKEDILALLHEAVGVELLDQIKDGGCDPRILKEAREFLKDNGISSVISDSEALSKLQEEEIVLGDQYLPDEYKVVGHE